MYIPGSQAFRHTTRPRVRRSHFGDASAARSLRQAEHSPFQISKTFVSFEHSRFAPDRSKDRGKCICPMNPGTEAQATPAVPDECLEYQHDCEHSKAASTYDCTQMMMSRECCAGATKHCMRLLLWPPDSRVPPAVRP